MTSDGSAAGDTPQQAILSNVSPDGQLIAYGDLRFSFGVRRKRPDEAPTAVGVAEEDAKSVGIVTPTDGATSGEGFHFDLDVQRAEPDASAELRTAVTEHYPQLPIEE